MRLLRILPERWQRLIPEMTKFAIIGAINTAVDMAIYNALLLIGPLKAKAISTIIATTLSYVMNRYWTYARRERTGAHREYLLFFALNMVGFVIQTAPIGFAKYGLHFSEKSPELADWIAFNLANVVGTFLGMVFRFWSYRTFVFKAPATVAAAVDADAETELDAAVASETLATAGTLDLVAEIPRLAPAPRSSTDDEFAQLTGRLRAEFGAPGEGDTDPTLFSGEPTSSSPR